MSDIEGLLGGRVEIDPEKVERGLVKLVLVLIETVHQVIERQAIRRVGRGIADGGGNRASGADTVAAGAAHG